MVNENVSNCHECGKEFNNEELVQIENILVCAECKPILIQKIMEGQSERGFYAYGGFWIRFLAKFIDGLLLICINFPLNFLWKALVLNLYIGEATELPAIFLVAGSQMFFGTIIGIVYSVYFVTTRGATLGKMACGLKIINADGTEKISFGKAVGRYFAEMLSALICYVGYIMVAFDDEKRGLHDRICDTRVVKK